VIPHHCTLRYVTYVRASVLFIVLLTYGSQFTVASSGLPATVWLLFMVIQVFQNVVSEGLYPLRLVYIIANLCMYTVCGL